MIFLVGCGFALVGAPARAQEMPAPVDRQVVLLTRILQFDRALQERVGDEVVVALVYQGRFRASLVARDQVANLLGGQRVGRRTVRVVPVELVAGRSLAEDLVASGAWVVYVAPLRATDVAEIAAVTRALGILTSSGVPEYVSEGLAVGISLRGDRPEIVINLEAALAEGARFSSELLKLSRVVRTGGAAR